jgi:hypothetical protein
MKRLAWIATTASLLCPVAALGAPFQPAKSFPLISGQYVLSETRACQPTLNVTYSNIGGNNVVTGVSMSSPSSGQLSGGELTAANTNGSGTLTITLTQSQGDPIIVEDSNGGEWGTILGAGTSKGTVTFVQTAKTIALTDSSGTSTFQVYYGAARKGIAQSAAFAGLDDKGCMQAGSLSVQ